VRSKSLRIFLKSISIIFIILLTTLFSQASEKLHLRIWTDKNEYVTREPIIVNYEIKNISDTTVVLNFLALGMFFDIKDQHGKGYANKLHFSFGFAYRDSLKPGESYKSEEDVSDRYGVISPGEYTCFLKNPKGSKKNIFMSPEAKSNIIKIKVTAPKDDEKKALDLYLEAQKLDWCKDKDPNKWEQAFYKYLELAEKYPKSVYAPLSLYTALFRAHVIKDKNVVISVCKNLIENYPEFYYIDDTFYNLAGNFKVLEDKEGAIEYMKELLKKYHNTGISERAEYWLEKIEKWEFE
jgi:TolA-binding protein